MPDLEPDSEEFLRELYLDDLEYRLNPGLVRDELQMISFYLDTLGDFVDTEESKELAKMKSPDDYPYWWDHFRGTLLFSFVVSVAAMLEDQLQSICEATKGMSKSRIGVGDLRGDTIQKHKQFIQAFGNYQILEDNMWLLMSRIYMVRNIIVHERGMVAGTRFEQKLIECSKGLPGLSIEGGWIQVNREFCKFCVKSVEDFLTILFENCQDWCRRLKHIEFGK